MVTTRRLARAARATTTAVTAAALLVAPGPVAHISPAAAQVAASSGIMTRAQYEACQARDEAGFRAAIEDLTLKGLRAGLAGVDYRAVVNEEWRAVSLDATIDRQVDIAIAEVREETSWTTLLKSIGSEEQAKALATSVAERVYKSEPVKRGIEELAGGVGRGVGRRIELATSETAEPAMQCMQAFLGPRYGSTVARSVSRDAGKEYSIDSRRAGAEVSTGSVLSESAGGLTGAIILIVRRQLAGMASRIGSRIVGSVLSRLVGAVAGGVGLVLIAKDIWDFRHGVLPIISNEMKSSATKDKAQEELARALQEQIGDNLREISARTADRVLDIWNDFRKAHAKVLALADANPDFKTYLERVQPEHLARLDEVTALIAAEEGDGGVMKRLADGSLEEAVTKLPGAALDIARDTRSIAKALGWWQLAGADTTRVAESGLHKTIAPADLDRTTLLRILALGDRGAMVRVAALPKAQRAHLFELETPELRTLATNLGETELAGLADYMTRLDKAASGRILRAVAQVPSRMQVLGRVSVRDGIVASRDQSAAVAMMLTADGVPDVLSMFAHARLALDGRVSPILVWEKHPAFLVTLALAALILLAMLKRLVFGRRQRVIIQTVPPPPASTAPPIKTSSR